jgi:hypothetical protein
MAYPLNPTGEDKQDEKSFFIVLNSTLSWGLFGPARQGLTEDKSSSITAPE